MRTYFQTTDLDGTTWWEQTNVSDQFEKIYWSSLFIYSWFPSTASWGGKDLACIAPWLTSGKNLAKALAGGHRDNGVNSNHDSIALHFWKTNPPSVTCLWFSNTTHHKFSVFFFEIGLCFNLHPTWSTKGLESCVNLTSFLEGRTNPRNFHTLVLWGASMHNA